VSKRKKDSFIVDYLSMGMSPAMGGNYKLAIVVFKLQGLFAFHLAILLTPYQFID